MITKPLKGFVKKCCLVAENARYPALELYLTYVNWCLNAGAAVHDQFTFLEMLERTASSIRSRLTVRGLKASRCCRPIASSKAALSV